MSLIRQNFDVVLRPNRIKTNKPINLNILVIIPCYNEAQSLPGVLKSVLSEQIYVLNPLVVNDCSKDDTAKIARQYDVTLLDLPVNLGIGGAMQTGYRYAQQHGYDLAIQLDGDGQHLASEIPKLIQHHLASGANVVIGSRFLGLRSFRSSAARRAGIYCFHMLSRLLVQRRIYDCTSGFRLFDKKAIQLAAESYPDEYPEPESLIFFAKKGLKIEEIPVLMQERQGGQSSIRPLHAIYYMVKVSLAMVYSFFRFSKS
jgi:glycosyltransferase involved in cell wall biosynthesis